MSLFDRYGIKEVADVTFYELDGEKPGKAVLYLDTLKVSTTEQTSENTEARGGKGNSALMAWDYGKEITVNLEDALFSRKSLEVMYGAKSYNREDKILKSKYFDIKNTETPFFIWNEQKNAYFFNDAKVKEFGLPWKEAGHTTNSSAGNTSCSFIPVGPSQSLEGREIRNAYEVMPTRIPAHLAPEQYSYTPKTNTGHGADIMKVVSELKTSGQAKISRKGIIQPNTVGTQIDLSGYDFKINKASIHQIWLDGDDTPTGVASNYKNGTFEIILQRSPVSSPISYEVVITIEFEASQYIDCLQASIATNATNHTYSADYHYSYKTGDGMLELTEAGKKLFGRSYIILNGRRIPLGQEISLEEIKDAGLYLDENVPIHLDAGVYLFEVELDKETAYSLKAFTLDISANSFPGVYYVTGDTFVRNEDTGKDEFFQFILPKVKVLSENNTITMEADGDPTVFSMSLKALKPKNDSLMKLIQYKAGKYVPAVMMMSTFDLTQDTEEEYIVGETYNLSRRLGKARQIISGTTNAMTKLNNNVSFGAGVYSREPVLKDSEPTTYSTTSQKAVYSSLVNPNQVYFWGGDGLAPTQSYENSTVPSGSEKYDVKEPVKEGTQAFLIRTVEGFLVSLVGMSQVTINTGEKWRAEGTLLMTDGGIKVTIWVDENNDIQMNIRIKSEWLWTPGFWAWVAYCGGRVILSMDGVDPVGDHMGMLAAREMGKQILFKLSTKLGFSFLKQMGNDLDIANSYGLDDPLIIINN